MANVWAEQNGDNPFGSDALRDDVKAWQAFWRGGRVLGRAPAHAIENLGGF